MHRASEQSLLAAGELDKQVSMVTGRAQSEYGPAR